MTRPSHHSSGDAAALPEKPLSVPYQGVFQWRSNQSASILGRCAVGIASTALNGAQAIAAILKQNEIDRDFDDDEPGVLRLGSITTSGLIDALASCIELAEMQVTGGRAYFTTSVESGTQAERVMERAAWDARAAEASERAVDRTSGSTK